MKISTYLIVAIGLLTSCKDSLTEFQSQNFIKFFGNGEESMGNSVIIADSTESSYLFVGYDKDGGKNRIFAVKTDKFGNTIWPNRYTSGDSIEEGIIVKKIDNENFLIVGNSRSSTSAPTNPFILKVNQYGDLVWKKHIKKNFDLIINDFILADNKIFLVGESYENPSVASDTYISTFDLAGVKLDSSTKSALRVETFKKILKTSNGNLLVIGNSNTIIGSSINMVTYFEFRTNSINSIVRSGNIESLNDQVLKDAIFYNDEIFLLVDESNLGVWNTKVIKLSSSFVQIWETEPISPLQGQSMTLNSEGEIFVCGDSSDEIQLIRIDTQGAAYFGDAFYKKIPGSAGTIISTPDNGLLIVGTTASTYGTMVQLIKTDRDLYLLKP